MILYEAVEALDVEVPFFEVTFEEELEVLVAPHGAAQLLEIQSDLGPRHLAPRP